jgi:WD40 repeat protein
MLRQATARSDPARHMSRAGLRIVVFMGAGVVCLGVLDLTDSEITADPRGLGPGLIEQYRLGDQVWSLAFSAGDRHVASATITGAVTVKDLVNGQVLRLQHGPISSVRSLAFSSDGRVLAFTSGARAVRFRDIDAQMELAALETGGPTDGRLTFSPDGVVLAVGQWLGAESRRVVSVWDWKTGRRLAVLPVLRGGLNALVFSHDGKQLAVGDSSGAVELWDTLRWSTITMFQAHEPGHGGVSSLAFSPTGGVLATAGFLAPIVRLWDATTTELRATLTATGHVNGLGFSPDGTLLATAQGDGFIGVWDHAERRQLGTIPSAGRGTHAVAFSGDGRLLATGGFDGIVRLWDLRQVLATQPRLVVAASPSTGFPSLSTKRALTTQSSASLTTFTTSTLTPFLSDKSGMLSSSFSNGRASSWE